MRRKIIARIVIGGALAATIATHLQAQGRLEGRGPSKRFVSQRYGFSIGVPTGWNASLQKDTPMYINFSSSSGTSQLTLPPGGASIVVVAQDALPGHGRIGATPSQWAAEDARGVSANPPTVAQFEMPESSGVSGAVATSYDEATFSPDEQPQHSVSVYWVFNGSLFAGHLTYITRDRNAADLERVFGQTIRSIRPIGGSRVR